MSYKQAEFQPVLPNITDDSMKEVDKDVAMVGGKSSTNGESVNDTEKQDSSKVNNSSMGRKIIIGVLIVVIIVLLILLIYQIYKYYNTEVDIKPMRDDTSIPPPQPPPQPMKKETRPAQGIPEDVRNLDNSILSQYIKKGDNSTQQRVDNVDSKDKNSARHVGYKSMMADIEDNSSSETIDMGHISKIIDKTRESTSSVSIVEDLEEPSREDILQQMQKDMKKDKKYSETLESIEEEYGGNVINDFLNETETGDDSDETSSVGSDGEGCQFVLTKGKRRGQQCGRKRINETRCKRHEFK